MKIKKDDFRTSKTESRIYKFAENGGPHTADEETKNQLDLVEISIDYMNFCRTLFNSVEPEIIAMPVNQEKVLSECKRKLIHIHTYRKKFIMKKMIELATKVEDGSPLISLPEEKEVLNEILDNAVDAFDNIKKSIEKISEYIKEYITKEGIMNDDIISYASVLVIELLYKN